MNHGDKERLRKTHVELMENISPKDVLPLLHQEGIFNADDEERVLAEKTRKDKLRKLLSLLPLRGPQAYGVFRQALTAEYDWIVAALDSVPVGTSGADGIDGAAGCATRAEPIKELNHRVLVKVAHHPELLRDWKTLARCLQLEESDIVEVEFASPGNVKEQSYQALIKWQCRKGKQATPTALLDGLRDSGLNFLADELEGNATGAGMETEKEVDRPTVDRTLSKRERLSKARGLRNKLHEFLLSLGHASGIDMDDQKVTVYCPAADVETVKRALQEQLSRVDTQLHGFCKVVEAEFCLVRDQCRPAVGAGCCIQYEDHTGRRFQVTFGGVFKNLTNNKLYVMTTSHLNDARGRRFYYTSPSGDEVLLGRGVAYVQLRDPLIEACLVEMDEAVATRCQPCLSKSNPESPAVFRGPYTGPDEDLVPVDDDDVPTEVLMCTESMKRGRVKVIDFIFRDPDTDPQHNIMITGGMVTVPVGGDDLAVSGHSGAFIGLASAQPFTVQDWCLHTAPTHEATCVKQVYDSGSTLHRHALPIGEPSSNLHTTSVHLEEAAQPNPDTHIDVTSPPMSLTNGNFTQQTPPTPAAHQHPQHPNPGSDLVDYSIMGGTPYNAASGATVGVPNHSTPGVDCTLLAEQVSSHEAISMHCFGGPFPGHPERGSVSFRLDRTINELEKQLPNAELLLVPILRPGTEE